MIMSMRLPDTIYSRLTNLAEQTGRSKTYYILEALEDKIGELEFIYLAKQRAEDVRAGRSETVSWDSIKKEHGL